MIYLASYDRDTFGLPNLMTIVDFKNKNIGPKLVFKEKERTAKRISFLRYIMNTYQKTIDEEKKAKKNLLIIVPKSVKSIVKILLILFAHGAVKDIDAKEPTRFAYSFMGYFKSEEPADKMTGPDYVLVMDKKTIEEENIFKYHKN